MFYFFKALIIWYLTMYFLIILNGNSLPKIGGTHFIQIYYLSNKSVWITTIIIIESVQYNSNTIDFNVKINVSAKQCTVCT